MQNEEKNGTSAGKEKAYSFRCRRKITDVVFFVRSGLAILRFRNSSVLSRSAVQPVQRRIGLFHRKQVLCQASVSGYTSLLLR